MPRRLPQANAQQAGLGQRTIMNRTLAGQYGVDYVHLAAFAIDVDRVYERAPAEGQLPFGWEVFACARYVAARVHSATERGGGLLEDVVLQILAEPPGEPQLGAVLAFAIHAGVERGTLPEALRHAFASWRASPRQLSRALDACFGDPGLLARVALHCLGTPMDPPLSPPTLEALQQMAANQWASFSAARG